MPAVHAGRHAYGGQPLVPLPSQRENPLVLNEIEILNLCQKEKIPVLVNRPAGVLVEEMRLLAGHADVLLRVLEVADLPLQRLLLCLEGVERFLIG